MLTKKAASAGKEAAAACSQKVNSPARTANISISINISINISRQEDSTPRNCVCVCVCVCVDRKSVCRERVFTFV